MNLFLTVKEAARVIGVESKSVYYLAYMGYLEGWKIRGTWRFFKGSVEAYDQERNKGRTIEDSSSYSHDQGDGRVPSLFGFDDPPDDLGRTASRVHGRERVEHHTARSAGVSFKTFQPLTGPFQMDLFAEAV